jgi:(1->4)-alpha-D-glucan 1-alpha-D-glucosylmutase
VHRLATLGQLRWLYVDKIEALLAYRRDNPMLFARGGYQALTAAGSKADRICAVARRKEKDALIVVVARFPVRCEGERD